MNPEEIIKRQSLINKFVVRFHNDKKFKSRWFKNEEEKIGIILEYLERADKQVTSSIKEILEGNIKWLKGWKQIKNPNNNIPKEIQFEIIGYNKAIADTINYLEDIINKLK